MTALSTAGVAAVVAAAYLVGSGGGSNAKADTVDAAATPNVVTVEGAGQVAGTPDSMITTISVDTRGADPSVALDAASKSMALVQSTLLKHGVAAKDLQTTGLSVNPVYDYTKGRQVLHGYEADEQLSVTLRNLATAGKIIAVVTKVGGPQVTVGGITLNLEGDSTLVTNARAAAFADAKAKAEQYAALAGRTLGAVMSVSEVNSSGQPEVFAAASAAAAPEASVPIQAGSQEVSVDVTVVWTLN